MFYVKIENAIERIGMNLTFSSSKSDFKLLVASNWSKLEEIRKLVGIFVLNHTRDRLLVGSPSSDCDGGDEGDEGLADGGGNELGRTCNMRNT